MNRGQAKCSKTSRELQFKRMEPQRKDNSVDKESTLFKFSKESLNKNSADDTYDDNYDSSSKQKPSGKGSFTRRGKIPNFEKF